MAQKVKRPKFFPLGEVTPAPAPAPDQSRRIQSTMRLSPALYKAVHELVIKRYSEEQPGASLNDVVIEALRDLLARNGIKLPDE